MANQHKGCVIHHTVTSYLEPATVAAQGINITHRNRGFPLSSLNHYVGYHYLVDRFGAVLQTRKDDETGAHTREQNANFLYLGIALIGNFNIDKLEGAQYDALVKLVKSLASKYNWKPKDIRYHGEFKATACPGADIKKKLKQLKDDVFAVSLDSVNEDMVPSWGIEAINYFQERGILGSIQELNKPLPAYRMLEIIRKNNEWLLNKIKENDVN